MSRGGKPPGGAGCEAAGAGDKPRAGPPGGASPGGRGGFTLIEIAVALAVVVVMVGVAYPSMKGLREEREAREPLTRLEEMVQSIRNRAVSEGRPYQIVFFSGGFVGSRLVDPHLNPEELLAHLEAMEKRRWETREFLREEWKRVEVERGGAQTQGTAAQAGQAGAQAEEPDEKAAALQSAGEELERERMEWFRLEERTVLELRLWGETEWRRLDQAEGLVRWMFQPSGLAYPLSARFRRGETVVEGSFRPLTGELHGEKTYVP